MAENETPLISCEILFLIHSSKKNSLLNSSTPLHGTLTLLKDIIKLSFNIENEESIQELHEKKILLININSITLHPKKEEFSLNTKELNVSKTFSFFLCLELKDETIVKIFGISLNDAISLLSAINSSHNLKEEKQEEKRKKFIDKNTSFLQLNKYIENKKNSNENLSKDLVYSKSSSLFMNSSFNNDSHVNSINNEKKNKYTSLLHGWKNKISSETIFNGNSIEEINGNIIVHLSNIGANAPYTMNTVERKKEEKIMNLEISPPKTYMGAPMNYLDPFNPDIIHNIHYHEELQTLRGKEVGNNNFENNNNNNNNKSIDANNGHERRLTYLLKKLKEKSKDLEKLRSELHSTQEIFNYEAEQHQIEERYILENFKHLTPAQRSLLNFNALLEPLIPLEEFKNNNKNNKEKDIFTLNNNNGNNQRLNSTYRFSTLFTSQLQERSLAVAEINKVNISNSKTIILDETKNKQEYSHLQISPSCTEATVEKEEENNNNNNNNSTILKDNILKESPAKVKVEEGDEALKPALIEKLSTPLLKNKLPPPPPPPPVTFSSYLPSEIIKNEINENEKIKETKIKENEEILLPPPPKRLPPPPPPPPPKK